MEENNLEVDEREEIIKKRRKRLKISIGVMALVLLIIVTLYAFVRSHYEMPNEIDDLNNNIDLPYKFATLASEYDIDMNCIDEYELRFYVEREDEDAYMFSGYPDYSSLYKFTYYATSNSKVSLFEFKVGDQLKKADKKLKRHGYSCEGKYGDLVMYQRGQIEITIYIRSIKDNYDTDSSDANSEVVGYAIKLISTDKYNKGYYK